MNPFIPYLVKSVLCISLLFVVYWLFLRKDTFFSMNRVYLITMVIGSILFPLFSFTWVPAGRAASVAVMLEPVLVMPAGMVSPRAGQMGWIEVGFIVYLTGMFIFLFRFLGQLMQLMMLSRRFGMKKLNGLNVVCVDLAYAPFSFFSMIFMNEKEIQKESLEAILNHENVHIRQKHTLDLILMEILIILQWFNPVAWLVSREMKIVHEYLADEGVLQTGISRSIYQQMILNETMGIRVNNLTNNFNISLIKKRILMMKKSKSGKWAKGKVLMSLPVLFGLLFILTARSYSNSDMLKVAGNPAYITKQQGSGPDPVIQDKPKKETQIKYVAPVPQKEVYKVVEKQPSFPGGQDGYREFLIKNIRYPEAAVKKSVTGTVYITFVVENNGVVTNVKVLRGIGSGCDEEAVRVVKMMPNWIPGENKGKPVAVQYNLPIKFALDCNKKEEVKK